MEGFSVGNSKYTLHSLSTDEGKSFPWNNYKINTIMHFSTPHFLLMDLRLRLGKKTLSLKDRLGSSKQKASSNSSKIWKQFAASPSSWESFLLISQFSPPLQERPNHHFGLINLRRCCSLSRPASFGSAWCLLGPLTVGCHNNLWQKREAWRSSGWTRWRGGGRTDSWDTRSP